MYSTTQHLQGFALRVSPKPSGINSTPQGKAVVMERTKKMMESSLMILAVPFEGVTKENTDLLKNALPEGVKASMVKNALIRKCVEGTDFVPLAENLKQENMFLFCPEGTSQASYAALKKWQKEVKRTEPEFCAKVVVIEGEKYNGTELEYVVNLPTKKELLARLCRALKDPPTRLARALKAIPERMAKVFGQVLLQKEEEAKLAALVERIPAAEAAGPRPDDSATSQLSSDAALAGSSDNVNSATTSEFVPQVSVPVTLDSSSSATSTLASTTIETAAAGATATADATAAVAEEATVAKEPTTASSVIQTAESNIEATSAPDSILSGVPAVNSSSDTPAAVPDNSSSEVPSVTLETTATLPTITAGDVSASLDSVVTVTSEGPAVTEDAITAQP